MCIKVLECSLCESPPWQGEHHKDTAHRLSSEGRAEEAILCSSWEFPWLPLLSQNQQIPPTWRRWKLAWTCPKPPLFLYPFRPLFLFQVSSCEILPQDMQITAHWVHLTACLLSIFTSCFVHRLKIVLLFPFEIHFFFFFFYVFPPPLFFWNPVQNWRTNYFHTIEALLQAFLLLLPSIQCTLFNMG